MADEKIDIDLDPKKILKNMQDVGVGAKKLGETIDKSLGKDSAKSFDNLASAAERGSLKLYNIIKNLTKRVASDLKTAFDVSSVLEGAKFAKGLHEGVVQVFEMERAFDRLNTRLGLTASQMEKFKASMGKSVASTGQKLEDILPGVETFSAKGNIKDTQQLANIGNMLGQAKAITGEDVGGLSDAIIEILKNQGEQINDKTIKATMDAIEGARTSGAFKSAGEAAGAMEQLAPHARYLKLSTRELGGLTATAGRAGEGGQNILQQLLARGSSIEGQSVLNSIFGVNLFKKGKLDASQIGKINTEKFGTYSAQILESATGLQGASGQDLKRFIEAFKKDMSSFDKVVRGANETSNQFAVASDNLASKIDRFKENVKNAGLQIGSGLSNIGNQLLKGNWKEAWEGVKSTGGKLKEHGGTIAEAGLLTAGVGMLMGGSLKSLFKKIGGGLGGTAAGVMEGKIFEKMGVQPVYVVNAAEIGGGINVNKIAEGAIPKAAKSIIPAAASIASAIAIPAAAIGSVFYSPGVGGGSDDPMKYMKEHPNEIFAQLPAKMEKAVENGTTKANQNRKVNLSNPSDISGRGRTLKGDN